MKKNLFIYVIIAIFAISFYSCNPVGSIKGVVKDAKTDQFLENVKITLSPSEKSIFTSDKGEYVFSDLEEGSYTLVFEKTGYTSKTSEAMYLEKGEDKTKNETLDPELPTLTVDNTLLDFGMSISSKNITITNTGTGLLDFKLSSDVKWISFPTSGANSLTANQSKTIEITILQIELPAAGVNNGKITVSPLNGTSASVEITVLATKNSQPTASFSISETNVFVNQSFTVDASASSDAETVTNNLQVRWQWEEGGTFSEYTTTKTSSHFYASSGVKTIRLEVKDENGLTNFITKQITVSQVGQAPTLTNMQNFNTYNNFTMVGANISNLGTGATSIIDYGFCWSLTQNPTIESNSGLVQFGSGTTGNFYDMLENLQSSTNYNVRAFAKNNNNQLTYSDNRTFTTPQPSPLPVILSGWATNVTQTSAKITGFLLNAGVGITIVEKGFVYATTSNPTYSNFHIAAQNPSQTGEFSINISSLTGGQTYYARAYIKTSNNEFVYSSNEIQFVANSK